MDNPQDSIWYCLDWESEVITTTLCSTANVVSLTFPSIEPLNNPEDVLYCSIYASVLKFHTHHAEYYQLPLVQKPTAIGLIIYKRSTHTYTKLRYLGCSSPETKLSHTGGNKRNSRTLFPSSFDLINTRNKNNKTIGSVSVLISFGYTRNKRKNSSTRQISLTCLTNGWADVDKRRMVKCFPRAPGFYPKQ